MYSSHSFDIFLGVSDLYSLQVTGRDCDSQLEVNKNCCLFMVNISDYVLTKNQNLMNLF